MRSARCMSPREAADGEGPPTIRVAGDLLFRQVEVYRVPLSSERQPQLAYLREQPHSLGHAAVINRSLQAGVIQLVSATNQRTAHIDRYDLIYLVEFDL